MGDDVPDEVKNRRLNEIIELQNGISRELNALEVGTLHAVLVEGPSKKSAAEWKGRTDTNKTVVFPHEEIRGYVIGDVVHVRIERSSSATLFGRLV
jgi:tRNA-2-methylthio-N6-dimethylallyladenosine synthase